MSDLKLALQGIVIGASYALCIRPIAGDSIPRTKEAI